MADVSVTIGGRAYSLHCRDGDEPRLMQLAATVEEHVRAARQGAPGLNEVRGLLIGALFLADALADARQAPPSAPPPAPAEDDGKLAAALEGLAERMEKLAEELGKQAEPSYIA